MIDVCVVHSSVSTGPEKDLRPKSECWWVLVSVGECADYKPVLQRIKGTT